MLTSMTTYSDFWIKIEARVDRGYRVSVIQSPAGGGSEILPFDIDAAKPGARSPLQTLVRSTATRDVSLDDEPLPEPRDVGRALFDGLFSGAIRSLFDKSLGMAQAKGTGLRIKLQIDPEDPDLAPLVALPWEMMYFHGTREYLSLSEATPVVRFLDVQRPYERPPFTEPLRVLVAMANPEGSAHLDLQKERAAIETTWAKLPHVEVKILDHATRESLLETLSEQAYHVLHFMGHGGFNGDSGEGVLLLETATGAATQMSGMALGVLLRDMPAMRLVFLNACDTARLTGTEERDPFAGVASALVMAGVPAVLAMQFPVTDAAAVAFSDGFYAALARQRPVDAAVTAGRKAVHDARPTSMEWATPVLFMRAPDGYLFIPVKPFLTTGRTWAVVVGVLLIALIAAAGTVLKSSKPISVAPAELRTTFPRTVQLTPLSNGAPVVADTWTSSDTTVAVVRDGRVLTRRAGSTRITAKLGWFSKGSSDVTVVAPAAVAVQLARHQASMTVGDTLRIPARALAADNVAVDDVQLRWSSGDDAVVRVTPGGNIVGVAAGRTTVRVASASSLTDSVQVAVVAAANGVTRAAPTADDAVRGAPTDTAAPLLVRFALSRKSTYVRTRFNDETYYSATARYAVSATDADDDAWYAPCDALLEQPDVLKSMMAFSYEKRGDGPIPAAEVAEAFVRPGAAAQYRGQLREELLIAPGRTPLSSLLEESRRASWLDISDPGDRSRVRALAAACTPPQPQDALLFTVTLKNPSTAYMNITAVRYFVLDDAGAAGGGAGAGALEPLATYVHRIKRNCALVRVREVYLFPLTPLIEVAPGRTAVIDLQPTFSTYRGAFLAPLSVRVEIETDRGRVRSGRFWVEGPSCAG